MAKPAMSTSRPREGPASLYQEREGGPVRRRSGRIAGGPGDPARTSTRLRDVGRRWENAPDVPALDASDERPARPRGVLGGPPRLPPAARPPQVPGGRRAGLGLDHPRHGGAREPGMAVEGPARPPLPLGNAARPGASGRWIDAGRMPASTVPGGRPVEGEAVVALGLVLWASASLAIPSLLGPVKVVSDGPIYHLYFAARWWKAGRLFLVASPFGENAATYFPAVGDLWFTWLLAAWGGDRLAKIGQAPFLLVVLPSPPTDWRAAWVRGVPRRSSPRHGSSRRRRSSSSPSSRTSTRSSWPAISWPPTSSSSTPWTTAGRGRSPSGPSPREEPWGRKATGIVFVPVLLVLALLAALRRHGLGSRTVLHVALLLTLPAVMAGYWYGRNAAPDRQPALSPPPRSAGDGPGSRVGTAPT